MCKGGLIFLQTDLKVGVLIFPQRKKQHLTFGQRFLSGSVGPWNLQTYFECEFQTCKYQKSEISLGAEITLKTILFT